jgi:predicted enzyme related to lactoylglutathione lyase
MHISVVTLHVSDLERAIAFYTDKLGWEKTMDAPMGDGTRWVTVAPTPTQTAFTLSTDTPDGSAAKAGGFSGVVLEVDDVKKTYDQLSKLGVEFEQQPRTEPWGQWAMFKDSEGNIHGLHSEVTAASTAN